MINVESAKALIEKNRFPKKVHVFCLDQAWSQNLASSIKADRDYPPYDRVMMDGIAVSYEIYQSGVREFSIEGIAAAGDEKQKLKNQENCLEVMTGSVLPEGCSLIIPYEEVVIENKIAKVHSTQRKHMQFVHLKGSDLKAGQEVLTAGSSINGPRMGIVTSFGEHHAKVHSKPRVNIISTGDELIELDQSPKEHQIRRSNVYALRASLEKFGYQTIEISHLDDDEDSIWKHFKAASEKFDVLIYSGGVSKGKFDFLPSTWEKCGVERIFHRVTQKPGKPMYFGLHKESKTEIYGLPGNPMSSLVCLHKYFLDQKPIYAKLDSDILFKKDLTYFLPAKINYTDDAQIIATPLSMKNSGSFPILADSDGFLELPADKDCFKAGEIYAFHSWGPR